MSDHRPDDDVSGIPRSEYRERIDRCRQLADQRGFNGAVVFGRGGGPFERHGDLQYLTGHYTTFPNIPDHPPHWQMRGHAAAVIGPDRTILLSDDAPEAEQFCADDLRQTTDLPAALQRATRELGLAGNLALIGADAVSGAQIGELTARIPGLAPADGLLDSLRQIKSPAEQSMLRRAADIGSKAVDKAIEGVEVGATATELAAEAARTAIAAGAAVANIFAEISGPDRPPRRIPFPPYSDPAPMREGDILTIDMSGCVGGYFFDFSRTRVAGEDVHGGFQAFDLASRVVEAVVERLVPGATVKEAAEIGLRIESESELDLASSDFSALGHGLGLGFEGPWITPDDRSSIEPGMCIAIERYVSLGHVGATFEHDVIVREEGPPEILDSASDAYSAS